MNGSIHLRLVRLQTTKVLLVIVLAGHEGFSFRHDDAFFSLFTTLENEKKMRMLYLIRKRNSKKDEVFGWWVGGAGLVLSTKIPLTIWPNFWSTESHLPTILKSRYCTNVKRPEGSFRWSRRRIYGTSWTTGTNLR
jgi:hypothetical protein